MRKLRWEKLVLFGVLLVILLGIPTLLATKGRSFFASQADASPPPLRIEMMVTNGVIYRATITANLHPLSNPFTSYNGRHVLRDQVWSVQVKDITTLEEDGTWTKLEGKRVFTLSGIIWWKKVYIYQPQEDGNDPKF